MDSPCPAQGSCACHLQRGGTEILEAQSNEVCELVSDTHCWAPGGTASLQGLQGSQAHSETPLINAGHFGLPPSRLPPPSSTGVSWDHMSPKTTCPQPLFQSLLLRVPLNRTGHGPCGVAYQRGQGCPGWGCGPD